MRTGGLLRCRGTVQEDLLPTPGRLARPRPADRMTRFPGVRILLEDPEEPGVDGGEMGLRHVIRTPMSTEPEVDHEVAGMFDLLSSVEPEELRPAPP